VSDALLKAVAAKRTGARYAFVARYPASTVKMPNENVELNIYLSE